MKGKKQSRHPNDTSIQYITKLIEDVREKLGTKSFRGDTAVVEELLNQLLFYCSSAKIMNKYRRDVAVKLIRELQRPEPPTVEQLIADLPKWIAAVKDSGTKKAELDDGTNSK